MDELLDRAIAQASSGRNDACFRMSCQLRDNRYDLSAAECVVLQYQAAVEWVGNGQYTVLEALATLRSVYRSQAREPWNDGGGPGGGGTGRQRNAQRLQRLEQVFGNAPPATPVVDTQSVERYKRQLALCGQVINYQPAVDYLATRGISAELATAARCGFTENWRGKGGYWPAVVFHLFGENGEPVALHGRAIDKPGDWWYRKKQTKGPMSLGVFYTPGALDDVPGPIAIIEAPIDALSLAEAGMPAIATCGTRNPPAWVIKRIAMTSKIVYLAHDNDAAGDAAAEQTGLSLYLVEQHRLRPRLKDWNADLVNDGLDTLRKRLMPLVQPEIQTATAEPGAASPLSSEQSDVLMSILRQAPDALVDEPIDWAIDLAIRVTSASWICQCAARQKLKNMGIEA